jgi:hypothetical protein
MNPRDERWWAYVDNEMSAMEAAEYDRSLSPEDRERAAADMQFETELGKALGAHVPCPKEAWHAALLSVRQAQKRRMKRLWRLSWIAAPLTAAAVGFIVLMVRGHSDPTPLFLSLEGKDVDALASSSQVKDGVPGVRTFMRERSLPVTFNPAYASEGQSSPHQLLGAREDTFCDEPVTELLFNCGGEPAVLVLTYDGSAATKEISKGLAAGAVRNSRYVSGMLISVVGANAPPDLINAVGAHSVTEEDPLVAPVQSAISTDTLAEPPVAVPSRDSLQQPPP